MNAVNAVLLFFLVWTFSAVCQANDDDRSVSCDVVTGTVGNEVNLTCSISLQCADCFIKEYKFQYPKIYNKPPICKQEPSKDTCEQRNMFTCRYTPNKAMTEKFRFFVQTTCGTPKSEFTVDISEPSLIKSEESENTESKDTESKNTVISSVVGCSVIIILIIILIAIIYKKQSFGFQRRMFPCIKQNDDNSNCPENVI